MGEESSCCSKPYVWFFRSDHRQLQKLYLAGLSGKHCPLHTRTGVHPVHCSLWRELQLRTQDSANLPPDHSTTTTWPCCCFSAFLTYAPCIYISKTIRSLWQRPSSIILSEEGKQEEILPLWFSTRFSFIPSYSTLFLPLGPRSTKLEEPFVQAFLWNEKNC